MTDHRRRRPRIRTMRPPTRVHALVAALAAGFVLGGCTGGDGPSSEAPASAAAPREGTTSADAAAAEAGAAATNVPVSVAAVSRKTLDVTVTAPGRTEALRQDRIRAPYASRVMSLRVADGDRVEKDQVVAVVVSKNSAAALAGAQQMLAAARGAGDKADAERAVEVARTNLVQQSLRAPAAGVVLAHSAETGDYVDESEVLVTLAETQTLFFDAQVAQSDVQRVQPGQTAHIDLPAASSASVGATVHGRLAVASSQNFSAPVRLDFSPPRPDLGLGLFGTASIVVAQHRDATVVPASAVLRDDVTGVTRVAVVDSGTAHWLTVTTGVSQGGAVEIVSPPIATGTRVITDGQVGLPEGAKVAVQP